MEIVPIKAVIILYVESSLPCPTSIGRVGLAVKVGSIVGCWVEVVVGYNVGVSNGVGLCEGKAGEGVTVRVGWEVWVGFVVSVGNGVIVIVGEN